MNPPLFTSGPPHQTFTNKQSPPYRAITLSYSLKRTNGTILLIFTAMISIMTQVPPLQQQLPRQHPPSSFSCPHAMASSGAPSAPHPAAPSPT
jgi:hypothetical protein